MKKMPAIVLSLCLLFSVFMFPFECFADVWLDEIILFDQPDGSSTQGGPASYALGANDNKYVSVDIPETLILAFTDNTAYNGNGNDIKIYQYAYGDSDVAIYASMDNITYVYLGQTDRNVEYDLSDYGLSYVNYIKFVGLDDGGTSAGYDLDAVEALNSGVHQNPVPLPAAIYLLGSGLVGLIGVRRKFEK
jgi:hypothetical protein